MNNIVIIGRLTADPEMRSTNTGKSTCNFSVAVDKRFKPKDGTQTADFFRVTTWDKTAEFVSNYLKKGGRVAVQGRMESRTYQKDGHNVLAWEINADNVQSLEPIQRDGGSAPSTTTGRKAAASAPAESEYDPFDTE